MLNSDLTNFINEHGYCPSPLKKTSQSLRTTNDNKWHKVMCPNITGFYFQPQPNIEHRNELNNNLYQKSQILSN